MADVTNDTDPRALVEPMSVREFARKSGLSPATAHRVKSGAGLSLGVARQAAPFLQQCPCCGDARTADATAPEVKVERAAMTVGYDLSNGPDESAIWIRNPTPEMIEVIRALAGEQP